MHSKDLIALNCVPDTCNETRSQLENSTGLHKRGGRGEGGGGFSCDGTHYMFLVQVCVSVGTQS